MTAYISYKAIKRFTLSIFLGVATLNYNTTEAAMNSKEQLANFKPDYIIVGSGAGGGVLAARLAEDKNNKVLVIEMGPDNTENPLILRAASAGQLWGVPKEMAPDATGLIFTMMQNGKLYGYPRGNGPGGSVNHHALVDGRGSEDVYDTWAELTGDPMWKGINCRKYFMKSEDYDAPNMKKEVHGQNGWLSIRKNKNFEKFGEDIILAMQERFNIPFRDDFYDNLPDITGIGLTDAQRHLDGRRSYVATDLLLPRMKENDEKGWNNLQIITDHLVTKVIFDGDRAVGVEAIDARGAYRVDQKHYPRSIKGPRVEFKAAKEVILSGGSINTPQILLLSGVGPKEEIEKHGIKVVKDMPGVGKNLLDHIELSHIYDIKKLPNKAWVWQATVFAPKNPEWEKLADPEVFNQFGVALMCEWSSGYDTPDKKNPDLHTHFFYTYNEDFNLDPAVFKSDDPYKDAYIDKYNVEYDPKNPVSRFGMLTEIMITVADKGTITLKNADPTEQPIIDAKLYEAEPDVERMAMGLELQRELMKHPEIAKYEPVEIYPGPQFKTREQIKDFIKKYSSFGHHISGTTKMGKADDPMAVTDSSGRVIGLKNLRICDASLFPTIPSYNPSKAVYMVAEVIADKIKAGS